MQSEKCKVKSVKWKVKSFSLFTFLVHFLVHFALFTLHLIKILQSHRSALQAKLCIVMQKNFWCKRYASGWSRTQTVLRIKTNALPITPWRHYSNHLIISIWSSDIFLTSNFTVKSAKWTKKCTKKVKNFSLCNN